MRIFLLSLLGLILGVLIDEDASWFFGCATGGFLGFLFERERAQRAALEKRLWVEVASMQARLDQYRSGLADLWDARQERTAAREEAGELASAEESPAPAEATATPAVTRAATEPVGDEAAPPADVLEPSPASPAKSPAVEVPLPVPVPAQPSFDPALWLKELLLGGNTVVRVGILVLLVGVTLLLKYAAEHSLFPIELRMASGAGAGLVLILVGLRVRGTRAGFGETLQGGGIAAMYLVVFFSFRVYRLLPSGLAFGLLAAIACLSAVLAVLQNAMALIVIGQAGGFLAPVLASTGRGDHVGLFSYYLVLNVAIAGVAWFRAWRPLNLIGFAFTFGIGTTWGVLNYRPEHFASTEPFLIAFFLLYLAIPVLFALKGPAKGWVDGTLVFGAPLAFLALQLVMTRKVPFGMAYSTVALCALYLGLVRALRHRAFAEFSLMRTSFLALGVGFGTLAIPYAFDSSGLSAATWAVEGAGLYFLGVRQNRLLSRALAVGLQLLAGVTILLYLDAPPAREALPFLHGRVLASVFLALSSLFIAANAHRQRAKLAPVEPRVLQPLIAWALLLLIPTLDAELHRVTLEAWLSGARLGVLGALGLLLEALGRRLTWPAVRYAPVVLVFLLIPLLLLWHSAVPGSLLAQGGFLGWPLYFASVYFTLRRFVPEARDHLGALHPLALWGSTLFVALLGSELCMGPLELGDPWASAAFGLGLAGAVLGLSVGRPARWPVAEEPQLYLGVGRAVLGFGALLWTLWLALSISGGDLVLGYVPFFNPAEVAQSLGLLSVLVWARSEGRAPYLSEGLRRVLPSLALSVAFVSWNSLMARSAHRYFDVGWDPDELWNFGPLQVAVSISWAIIGLLVTVIASRSGRRPLWMAAAALLGVVVVKLFAVDLANLSTLAKIATFLVVGVLLLLVGYLSPMPPAAAESREK